MSDTAVTAQQVREIAALLIGPDAGDTPRLRQGVIAGVEMGRVSVLLDGPFPIGGVPFFSNYLPRIGDVVWLLKNGSDMFVVDKIQPGGIEQEPWHVVGLTDYNEPAFQNDWFNYGTTDGVNDYEGAMFYKDVDGWVHLQGLLRNTSGAAYNSVMFTLPEGYRPPTTRRIPCLRDANEIWQLEIRADGTVRAATANNTDNAQLKGWISLSGARFMAAGLVDYDREHEWTPFGYAHNLWTWDTSAGAGTIYDMPAMWHRWDGLVRCRGSFGGGNGPIVGYVSERAARSRYAKVFPTCSYTGFITIEPARMDVLMHNRALRTFTYDPNWNEGMAVSGLQWFADIPENYWTALPLQNSWQNYLTIAGSTPTATVYAPVTYFRDGYGVVHVRGLVRAGTVSGGIIIATLPEGHWPTKRLTFSADSNTGFGRVDVDPLGNIRLMAGSNGYFSLDMITFRAAGT